MTRKPKKTAGIVVGTYVPRATLRDLKSIAARRRWSLSQTIAFASQELVARDRKRRAA